MSTKENPKFGSAWVAFHEEGVSVWVYPCEGARMYAFRMEMAGRHLDWQVACAAQIFNALRTIISAVEYLTLAYGWHLVPSEWNNEADRTQWRNILRSFGRVKPLVVRQGLVKALFHSLLSFDGDSLTEVLSPESKEVLNSATSDDGTEGAFTDFINARQNAGYTYERASSLNDGRTLWYLANPTTLD